MGSFKAVTNQGTFVVWAGRDWHAEHLLKRAGLRLRGELEGVGQAGREALSRQGAMPLYADFNGNPLTNGDRVTWREYPGGKKRTGELIDRLPGGWWLVYRDGKLSTEKMITKEVKR